MQVFQVEAYWEPEVQVSTSQMRVLLWRSHLATP